MRHQALDELVGRKLRSDELRELRPCRLEQLLAIPAALAVDAADHREDAIGFNSHPDVTKSERDHERCHLAPDLAVGERADDLADPAVELLLDGKMIDSHADHVTGNDEPARLGDALELG